MSRMIEYLIAVLFGRKRVWLLDFDGGVTPRWAKWTPHGFVCRRYLLLSHTKCLLLPGGEVRGPTYVESWRGGHD